MNTLDQGMGPAVLLIHAFPLNHTMWEPQLTTLTRHFRVIAPDIRGFGGSHPASPWTMEEMADGLNSMLDRLGITTCAVAGVSMGGYIALPFWFKYPHRVRRLVLANTRARADNETEKAARNEMIAAIEANGTAILPDRMLPRLLGPKAPAAVVTTIRKMIEGVDPAAAAYAVMAMRDRVDFSTEVQRIQCPTMVVTGEDDVIIRLEDSQALADSIPGAQYFQVPDSGHLSNLENPADFNRVLLEFLRS
jgi:pimeloyl-ACP methyl ester carboxylesterase